MVGFEPIYFGWPCSQFELIWGIYKEITERITFNVLMIGLDGSGKTNLLETIRYRYTKTPRIPRDKIMPTTGQNGIMIHWFL